MGTRGTEVPPRWEAGATAGGVCVCAGDLFFCALRETMMRLVLRIMQAQQRSRPRHDTANTPGHLLPACMRRVRRAGGPQTLMQR